MKTKVYILYTGGTIGMAPKDPSNLLSPLVPKHLTELKFYMPDLYRFEKFVEFGEETPFDPPLDSSDVNPTHWIEIARRIKGVYDDFDGFIVLHGTDTMAYTASGLSFIFENLSKPVVVTGSQLPMSAPRSDAISNLTNAIHIAGYKAFRLPRIPEVVICFADRVLRGNRATKVSSTQFDAFDSPNFPPLAEIGRRIQVRSELILSPPSIEADFALNLDLDNSVIIVSIFPGFQPKHLKKLIDGPEIHGVILRTYGAGNIPNDPELLAVISSATQKGTIIMNVSQCQNSMVEMGLYASSSSLLELGVVSGLDMTTEAAMAKLIWILGSRSHEERRARLQVSQRGEQSESLFDLRFGKVLSSEARETFVGTTHSPEGFDAEQLLMAMVRISSLRLAGAETGTLAKLEISVNPVDSGCDNPESSHCLAVFEFVWEGKSINLIADVTDKLRGGIPLNGITLKMTLISPKAVFYHDGLCLALFTSE